MEYHNFTNQQLLEELANLKLNLPEELIREIVSRGDGIVDDLARFLLDKEMHKCQSLGDGWMPLHALHLLGMIATPKCIYPLIEALKMPEQFSDFLTESVPSILACIGEPIIEPLKDFIIDRNHDDFSRSTSCRALVLIAQNLPHKKPIVVHLLESLFINREKENPYSDFLGLITDDLARLGDKNSLDIMNPAFKEGKIPPGIISWEDVIEISHIKDEEQFVPPEEYFSSRHLQRLKRINYFDNGKKYKYIENGIKIVEQNPLNQIIGKREKIGRNDSCPCGSGKKYKKCCLPRVESRGLEKDNE